MKPRSDEDLMLEALKEAYKAYENGEVPVGAIIVCNNKIIARAYNQVERLKDCTAHAELIAITSASIALDNKYLKNTTLYTTLEPCVMCAGAAYWAQIPQIVFAAKDLKNGYSLRGQLLHSKAMVRSGLLEQESSYILKKFFTKLRK
jgi:tRNA(adenine34) deaminase